MNRRRSGRLLLRPRPWPRALMITSCQDPRPVEPGPGGVARSPPATTAPTSSSSPPTTRPWSTCGGCRSPDSCSATAGVTFENFVAPHPLCCPARAQILTGQYAQNNGVRSNHGTTAATGAWPIPSTPFRCGCRTPATARRSSASTSTATSPGQGIPPGWERWDADRRGWATPVPAVQRPRRHPPAGLSHRLRRRAAARTRSRSWRRRTSRSSSGPRSTRRTASARPRGRSAAPPRRRWRSGSPTASRVSGRRSSTALFQRGGRSDKPKARDPARPGRRGRGAAAVPSADPVTGLRRPRGSPDRDCPARDRRARRHRDRVHLRQRLPLRRAPLPGQDAAPTRSPCGCRC